jgi:hypothetical protein
MHLHRIFILSFFLVLNATILFAQNNWKLATADGGIEVYTSTVPASKIKAVKVTCDFPAKSSSLVALLLDVESAPEWLYHTKSCKLIKQVSPAELYYYSEVAVPWPVETGTLLRILP